MNSKNLQKKLCGHEKALKELEQHFGANSLEVARELISLANLLKSERLDLLLAANITARAKLIGSSNDINNLTFTSPRNKNKFRIQFMNLTGFIGSVLDDTAASKEQRRPIRNLGSALLCTIVILTVITLSEHNIAVCREVQTSQSGNEVHLADGNNEEILLAQISDAENYHKFENQIKCLKSLAVLYDTEHRYLAEETTLRELRSVLTKQGPDASAEDLVFAIRSVDALRRRIRNDEYLSPEQQLENRVSNTGNEIFDDYGDWTEESFNKQAWILHESPASRKEIPLLREAFVQNRIQTLTRRRKILEFQMQSHLAEKLEFTSRNDVQLPAEWRFYQRGTVNFVLVETKVKPNRYVMLASPTGDLGSIHRLDSMSFKDLFKYQSISAMQVPFSWRQALMSQAKLI